LGRRSFECLEKEDTRQRRAYVAQNEQQQEQLPVAENFPEMGEALMMNKFLLKPEKENVKPTQRKALFRTMCKVKGKCCKMVIDNLVSKKMVENLILKNIKHPFPYKVSWLHKGHQILVSEQCEIDLQVGTYNKKNCM